MSDDDPPRREIDDGEFVAAMGCAGTAMVVLGVLALALMLLRCS